MTSFDSELDFLKNEVSSYSQAIKQLTIIIEQYENNNKPSIYEEDKLIIALSLAMDDLKKKRKDLRNKIKNHPDGLKHIHYGIAGDAN